MKLFACKCRKMKKVQSDVWKMYEDGDKLVDIFECPRCQRIEYKPVKQ